MASFPTPHTVGWHTASAGSETAHGEETIVYSPPRDAAGVPRRVIALQPTRSTEPETGRVISDLDLLVPPGFTASPEDLVDLPDGNQYTVVGYPMDYTLGPYGFEPGSVIQLRRVER